MQSFFALAALQQQMTRSLRSRWEITCKENNCISTSLDEVEFPAKSPSQRCVSLKQSEKRSCSFFFSSTGMQTTTIFAQAAASLIFHLVARFA